MNPKLDPHCVPNTFTNEECDKITQIGEDIGVKLSGIDVSSLNPIRKSWNSFIPFDKDVEWIYNRIGDVARDINSRWYHFDAEGFDEVGGYYDEHDEYVEPTKREEDDFYDEEYDEEDDELIEDPQAEI